MPRKRQDQKIRKRVLSGIQRLYFLDKVVLDREQLTESEWWELFQMTYPPDAAGYEEEIWSQYADELLAEYIEDYPGDRPSAWWRFDAREPRLRLGGSGTPVSGAPMWCSVPLEWIDVDPADPPVYESDPAYLKRLGLFLPREEEQTDPDAFAPVPLPAGFWQQVG